MVEPQDANTSEALLDRERQKNKELMEKMEKLIQQEEARTALIDRDELYGTPSYQVMPGKTNGVSYATEQVTPMPEHHINSSFLG